MYYIPTTQPYTNSWQHTVQVQNWQHQQDHDHAWRMSQYWARGWTFIDVQFITNQYHVHYRDHDGHYRTIFLDHDFHYLQDQDRYC